MGGLTNFIDLGGTRFHYLDFTGGGEPLLFLAGIGNSAWILSDLIEYFRRDYRCLAFTRRSHGESQQSGQRHDLDTLSEDIYLFVQSLGLGHVTLVGHSYAGNEITRLVSCYPDQVNQIVYLDAISWPDDEVYVNSNLPIAYPEPSDDIFASYEAYRSWLSENMFSCLWSDALEKDLRATTVIDDRGRIQPRTPDRVFEEMLSYEVEPMDFKGIQCPVLSLHAITTTFPGDQNIQDPELRNKVNQWVRDVAIPIQKQGASRLLEAIPDAQVVELTDTNHFCFIQKEAEVAGLMRDFLQR